MSHRPSTEISAELDQYGEMLASILSREGGIFVVDLKFFAQIVGDLKQELRLAEIREHHQSD